MRWYIPFLVAPDTYPTIILNFNLLLNLQSFISFTIEWSSISALVFLLECYCNILEFFVLLWWRKIAVSILYFLFCDGYLTFTIPSLIWLILFVFCFFLDFEIFVCIVALIIEMFLCIFSSRFDLVILFFFSFWFSISLPNVSGNWGISLFTT